MKVTAGSQQSNLLKDPAHEIVPQLVASMEFQTSYRKMA
jgi:hypothetical protein